MFLVKNIDKFIVFMSCQEKSPQRDNFLYLFSSIYANIQNVVVITTQIYKEIFSAGRSKRPFTDYVIIKNIKVSFETCCSLG